MHSKAVIVNANSPHLLRFNPITFSTTADLFQPRRIDQCLGTSRSQRNTDHHAGLNQFHHCKDAVLNCATPQTVLNLQDCTAFVASTHPLSLRKQSTIGQDVIFITNKLSSLHKTSKKSTDTCHILSPAARLDTRALHQHHHSLAPLRFGNPRSQVSRPRHFLKRLVSVIGYSKLTDRLRLVRACYGTTA